jgi:hypothetical protein
MGTGCGADDSAEASYDGAAKSPTGESYYDNGSGNAAAGAAGGQTPPPPPERELESSYGAPVATGKFVWIANPDSGRVAYIDAASLSVSLLDAGNGPTFVTAVPTANGADTALVLNVLSKDATLMTKDANGLATKRFAVSTGGNAWAVSNDGRWAIAWTDAARIAKKSSADGYQDLTVIDLANGTSTALGIGYRPVTIGFDTSASRAFAITQDGVSVIDLAGTPTVTKNVAIAEPVEGVKTRDVALTPDGAYALVRRDGASSLSIVSLLDDSRLDIPLPSPATDLDLSADGTFAIAVIREKNQALVLPFPAAATDASAAFTVELGDAGAGSVAIANQGGTALFFTNATPNPKLTVLAAQTEGAKARNVLLRAPIEAVFPSNDGAFGVVLHAQLKDDTGAVAYPAAMSLVPIAANLPAKIVGLPSAPVSVAFLPEGNRALIATGKGAGASYQMHIASFPSLAVQSVALASEPIAAGVVPEANRGFVAQRHPEGRITFVDFTTNEVRTITGFELAAQVVDGSTK